MQFLNLFFRFTSFLAIFLFYTPLHGSTFPNEKSIVVLVLSYNNINWVDQNISSILFQDYENYRVVYIDDCSTDGTADAVESLVRSLGQEHRFQLVRNQTRAGSPLANHYKGIYQYCSDHEIIACLDGDDWFANDQVLSIVNTHYSTQDVWLTHGTLMEYHNDQRNGTVGWSKRIPDEIIQKNAFRTFHCPSHLKTFYAWLFKKIKFEDTQYKGNFFPASADQAMMFPMIEMAGERHAFIETILYVYNMTNPLGLSIISTQLQRDCEKHVRSQPPYEKLELDSDGIAHKHDYKETNQ